MQWLYFGPTEIYSNIRNIHQFYILQQSEWNYSISYTTFWIKLRITLCFLKYRRVNQCQVAKQNETTELIKYLTSLKCPLVRAKINIHCRFRETPTWATLILLLLLLMHSCHQDYGQFIQNTPKTCIYFNIDSTLLWCVTSKTSLKISNFG